MVKDPITGRTDMVPVVDHAWGDKADSPATIALLGQERYDQVKTMNEEGGLKTVQDLHDTALYEVTSLLSLHLEDRDLGMIADQWIEAAELVRHATLRMATVEFILNIEGARTRIVLNITDHDVVLGVYCLCHGNLNTAPIVHWNDGGSFATAEVEPEDVDDAMMDAGIQMRRAENTRLAAAAKRADDEAKRRGVVSFSAFRAFRSIGAN